MTDAERRDATLRTVVLPDCCGNCRYYSDEHCNVVGKNDMSEGAFPAIGERCDLHERKPEEGR